MTTPLLFRRGPGHLLLAIVLGAAGGCSWDQYNPFAPTPPPPPADTLVLRPDGLAAEKPPTGNGPEALMAGARESFRREAYSDSEVLFERVAEQKTAPPALVQEAIYYRAESLRLQGYYPKAADVYVDLLNKFPHTVYREQAVQHMFDIANYWLNDTREEMKENLELREGKRWFVWPRFVSFDRTKPLVDREGRAVEKLDQVRLHDLTGPLSDTALFMCGTVKLYNEDYREAEHYFTQIHEKHPNSPLAPKAVELAIYSKQMCTGGADYDGRKVAEARQLVQAAFENYPKLAQEKRDFLMRQLDGINLQQAEKDYKMAQFYQRTGHPGSAYFYYELVRRRYPGTRYATLAVEQMEALRGELEKEQAGKSGPVPPPPAQGVGNPSGPGMAPGAGTNPGPLPPALR